VPLGVVGAVQELGSVVGPLYGALVLAFAGWEEIFWINLAVGLVLAAALRASATTEPRTSTRPRDLPGLVLVGLCLVCLLLVMLAPATLTRGVTTGLAFLPIVGDSRWLSPIALVLLVLVAALIARSWLASRPLLDLRQWGRTAARADLVGAGILAVALGGIILAFATADPEVAVFSPAGPWLLAVSAIATVAFWWHQRRTPHPLVPGDAFRQPPAWGALLVSFFVGAALIAALVDIPIFARITVYPESQLMAALVLLRLLVAIPVGALAGGYLTRHAPVGAITAGGMALAAAGFVVMAQWDRLSLEQAVATIPLVMAGLGFGLALAPVNAALLAATRDAVHGVASALLVVARMVGMLVGISALTTIGLRRYYAVQVGLPPPDEVCDTGTQCVEYTNLLKDAGLAQLQTVFVGAAVCSAIAAVLALVLFRTAQTRDVSTAEALRQAG
jgi:hypothetical protein